MPDDVYWCSSFGGYWHATTDEEPCRRCDEHDLRLDTFTRCQETTDVYLSLVEQLVAELEIERNSKSWSGGKGDNYPCLIAWYRQSKLLDRAKQIMEQKK